MPQPALAGTVLLIEDEADFRNVMRWRLEKEGHYKVLDAADGQSGIAMAIQHHPDVILTDYTMPRMNGHEVLQALRANQQTEHIPVILLTSLGSEQKVADSLAFGAACHVEKWADSKILLKEVQVAIVKHRQFHPSPSNRPS